MSDDITAIGEDALRGKAIERLKKRRDFYGHLLVYVLINGFIVAIWALATPDVFFWPVFPIVGWGIGLVINAWEVFRRPDFTEEQIRREISHLRGPDHG